MGIASIQIENFKSIKKTDKIKLTPINVLIGANGVGKSNFISFFKFLYRLSQDNLQTYIAQLGRAENFLHYGLKGSDYLAGKVRRVFIG